MSGLRVLVTGACGQDGVLLCRMLQARGVDVCGVDRVGASARPVDVSQLIELDLAVPGAVEDVLETVNPSHVIHLAACHHSSEGSGGNDLDREMITVNFGVTERMLAHVATRLPECRVLVAGSSQMYTAPEGMELLVDEDTPMSPSTLYGMTKAWSRQLLDHYRRSRGVFGTTAILFNHESRLRPPTFLTRKVSLAAARAANGRAPDLEIRDPSSKVDWCSATDVVAGLWAAVTAAEPMDYVFASGALRSVEDLLEVAFGAVGLDWRRYAVLGSPAPERRAGYLIGSPSRARAVLDWVPATAFETLVRDMVEADTLALARG